MKKKLYLYLALTGSLLSFDTTAQNTGPGKQLSAVLQQSMQDWSICYKHFSWNSFKEASAGIPFRETTPQAFEGTPGYYALYKPLLVYAPDKKYFIDLYSYQLNMEKADNRIVANPEIDQAVDLYCPGNQTRIRILFSGTAAWIEKAAWIDNNLFVLAGSEANDEHDTRTPFLYVGNVQKQSFTVYRNTDKSCIQSRRYLPASLKDMHFEGL